MDLAKPSLDIGLYVSDIDASRAFYESEVGLPYEELLKIGGGVHQHRLGLRGSVLKLNTSRTDLSPANSGYRRLLIAGAHSEARDLVDPDGIRVAMVDGAGGDGGDDAVTAIGIEIGAPDVDAMRRFYVDAMGGSQTDAGSVRVGTTLLRFTDDSTPTTGGLNAIGFRYLTVQVRDVTKEHERIVGLGYREAMPPRKLGSVAAISFVQDPGGNWIEISQRASLTGELPEEL